VVSIVEKSRAKEGATDQNAKFKKRYDLATSDQLLAKKSSTASIHDGIILADTSMYTKRSPATSSEARERDLKAHVKARGYHVTISLHRCTSNNENVSAQIRGGKADPE
jgi:hypothetical protein